MVSFSGKSVFALLAHQRTGTHYLASLLRSTGAIYHYDEVLMPQFPGALGEDGLFFSYLRKRIEHNWNELLLTDHTRVDSLFSGFFRNTCQAVSEPCVGYDIKIDQLNCFPRLYGSLQNWGVRVVHLVRKNYLARIYSHYQMQKWISQGNVDIHKTKLEVTPITLEVENTVTWICNDFGANQYVEDVFGRTKDMYLRLNYEDLVGASRDERMQELMHYLGVDDNRPWSTDTVKQNEKPLENLITNYGEIVQELKRRGFAHLVE